MLAALLLLALIAPIAGAQRPERLQPPAAEVEPPEVEPPELEASEVAPPKAAAWPWPYSLDQLRRGELDHVLHGTGPLWRPREAQAYQNRFHETPPVLVRMGVNLAPTRRATFKERVRKLEEYFALHAEQMLVLSLEWKGSLASGQGLGLSREVVAGDFDRELMQLANLVKSDGRPVFLRVGTESNVPHNGYQPEDFRAAFRYIVQLFRREKVDNAIAMWNFKALRGRGNGIVDWYPGDSWVDWWSIDIFRNDLEDPALRPYVYEFLGEALKRGKPVMIPECAPATRDLAAEETWDDWFEPFLRLVKFHPSIRGFCYSNRDFATQDARLTDWGDMRLDRSPLATRWQAALRDPLFLHAPAGTALAPRDSMDGAPGPRPKSGPARGR